jgi:hypothetical protein
MMALLPVWWLALLSQAHEALRLGEGPFWSGTFLCGQPLFGAPELPYASPAAGLLLAWGPLAWLLLHSLVFAVGVAQWLRRGEAAGLGAAAAVMVALLLLLGAWLDPEALALLPCWAWLPWVLLMAGEAPAWVAAPVVALLACAAAPLVLALGLLGSGWRRWRRRQWQGAWALGLLMAAPALLESLRLSRDDLSVGLPAWPLPGLGSTLLVAQAALGLLALLLVAVGLGRRRPLLLLIPWAALLAVAPHLFTTAPIGGDRHLPTYLRLFTRHQAPPGQMPLAVDALLAERWTGALGGMAARQPWQRWQRLSLLGQRDADTLDLAAVGWLDADPSQRWFQGVAAAVVDSAEGPSTPVQAGVGVLARPLRLARMEARPGASVWHVLSPRAQGPGRWDVDWDGGLPGWAYLSESYDPGWQAWDGARALPVVETEGGFMAALVDASTRHVQWRYRPAHWAWGAALALLGLGLWGWRMKQGRSALAH